MTDLIENKRGFLKQIEQKKAEIIALKHLMNIQETALLLNTDFKAEGLTNEKQRSAYINDKLRTKREELDWLKYDLTILENDVIILNDLINKKGDD